MTTTSLPVPLRTAPAARLAADTRYVVAGFPVALGTAVLSVAGLAAGAGLAVAAVGVPLLIATLGRARGFAAAERTRIATVLGRPVPEPSYRTGTAASPLRRLIVALADPQTWRDVAHAVLRVVPSGLALAVVVSWWAGVIGGLTWALWGWTLPAGPDSQEIPAMIGLGDDYLMTTTFYLVAALALARTLPVVVRAAALFEARAARVLLRGRAG